MTQKLVEAIRNNDYKEVESLLKTNEGKAELEQTIVLSTEDLGRLQRKFPEITDNQFKKLACPCPILFLPIIYGNFDIFDLLIAAGADQTEKNREGLSLSHYCLEVGFYSRFTIFGMNHSMKGNVSLKGMLDAIESVASGNDVISTHIALDDELDCLVDAVRSENLAQLNSCLLTNIHQLDVTLGKGSALYYALINGHRSVVEILKAAGAKTLPTHYYAAGQGPEETSVELYDFIKSPSYTRPANPTQSTQDLYDALYKGQVVEVYKILRDNPGLQIEPKHYYAAGRSRYYAEPGVASRQYKLLSYKAENENLPPLFLSEKESKELEGKKPAAHAPG